MESSLFDFFREVMLPRDPDVGGEPRTNERRVGYPPADASEARERLRFAMKFQQYTGPVQAKGLEDTAFYRYNLLLSLNEVGGDPEWFGRSADEFHEANAARLRDWPFEMLATATHDTKLGEDVRARINVLSEIPDDWSRECGRWMRLNRGHRTLIDGEPAPDRNDEYRFYQALVGVWPAELENATEAPRELVERISGYMLKAVREAKLHTSWLTANEAYEGAVARFVEQTLTGPGGIRFLPALLGFQRRVAVGGMVNALAQVAIKIGSPGVPDFYQGTELWDFLFVDPDNRRPVDFAVRNDALDTIGRVMALPGTSRAAAVAELLRQWRDGRIKLLVTAAGLRLRRELPDLFLLGDYLALATETTVHADAVAFARTRGDDVVVVVAPRLCASLVTGDLAVPLGGENWKTSRVMLPSQLAGRTFRHELTGAEIRPVTVADQSWIFLGQIFETVPAGILRAV